MKTQAKYNSWFQRSSSTKISASYLITYSFISDSYLLSIHWSNLRPDHKSSLSLRDYQIAGKASWVLTITNIHKQVTLCYMYSERWKFVSNISWTLVSLSVSIIYHLRRFGKNQQNLRILAKNNRTTSSWNFPSNLEEDFVFQHAWNLTEI